MQKNSSFSIISNQLDWIEFRHFLFSHFVFLNEVFQFLLRPLSFSYLRRKFVSHNLSDFDIATSSRCQRRW